MAPSSSDHPHNGDPTATEIYRVFRSTTQASIEGLKLLLQECADLRGELVVVHGLHPDVEGAEVFSARQRSRILDLQEAAKDMEALLVSLSNGATDARADA